MLILINKYDIEQLPITTSQEVRVKITEILKALDENYGKDRTIDEDGGYIAFFADKKDYENTPKEDLNFDIDVSVPEYVEIVQTTQNEYINALFLMNNETAVTVIMPKCAAPLSLLNELD